MYLHPMIPVSKRTPSQTFFLVLIIGLLNTITPFSIDMYLPAFPQIAAELHTDISHVALSVSTYFLGFAVGQLLYGPLLDRFGRKNPLMIGMGLYMAATIGCITCGSIDTFLWMRFIQALSGCVASVAAMAMVRDFFPVDQSARIISLLVLILGASPLLAPTAGSLVVVAWGWHYVFVLLAIIAGILLLVVAFFLPEGHTPDPTISLKPKQITKAFTEVISKPVFYVYALAGTFSFSGLFVYVADSPAVFMGYFQLSARQYGLVFALLSVGFIGGSQLNHYLSRKFESAVILKTTVMCQVVVSIIFLIGSLNDWYGFVPVLCFLFVLLLCAGLGYPNAAAMALAPFSRNAGSASALLGFLQIGIGGLISSGVGLLHFKGSLTMAMIMTATSIIAWIILWMGHSKTSSAG
jgi:DHA1 family bicyclomycin/chloramphenicol resistance-like MFS transporter